jgi:pectate lyase
MKAGDLQMNKRILLPAVLLSLPIWMLACDGNSGPGTSATGGARSGGATTGGVVGTGGATATGGARPTGGTTATGGVVGTSGATASGGSRATGGATASGGATSTGGATASGGVTASGGARATGGAAGGTVGTTATGGGMATGGAKSTGGTVGAGGAPATGGSVATGGTIGAGGTTASTGKDPCKPIGWATRTGRTGAAFSVTGGGDAAPIVVKAFADLKTYASDAQARVIHIDGTLGAGWSGSSGDRLEIKSNKTIVGLRPGTQLKAAVHINGASNVILRNIVIRGPGSNEDQAWDNINIEGSSKNVWVDHCEFWDGQDGNADVVKGADTVTFTWNIFGYALPGHPHNLSNLIASSDSEPESDGKLDITYMFNWWKAAMERQPRCRYGYIHVVNNLYTSDSSVGASKLGVTNGYMCNVRTENNHFISQAEPIDLGKQAGTGSVQEAIGNLFESCSGNQKGSGTAFTPPYEYKSFMVSASEVKALVQKYAGATLASPTACP